MIFESDFNMGVKDIGKNNYIKNRAILEMLENIGAYHSDAAGYGANDIGKTHVVWILAGWKLKVINRPKYGQKIHIKTWGRDMAKAITYRDFEVYNSKKELCAIATSKWVLVNTETGRITRITDEIASKYQPENNSVYKEKEIEKIELPEESEYTKKIEYTTTRRDIDLNGHMHNLYYLDLAYEALPDEVYAKRPYDNVQIQYKKEIKYGEKVICKYAYKNNSHIVAIYDEKEKNLHAVVKLQKNYCNY